MVLTTHAITGAAFASLTPSNPLLGFAVGFASHFILDAIPHWDYPRISEKKDKNNPMNNNIAINRDFVKDIFKMGIDGIIGLLITYFIFVFYLKFSALVILCGVAGGIVPDALQFVQMKWKHEPLTSLRRFHLWIQSWKSLDNKPLIGILSQILIICLVVYGRMLAL